MHYRSNRYDPNQLVRNDLSDQAKQSFQVVALLATILVVGIHYQSDVPDGPNAATATWNELAQEFLFGGVGRVAVPMFAFTAGFFYFRSDDGSSARYRKKLRQRSRTILLPYFIIASIAMATWLLVHRIEGDTLELTFGQILSRWWLRPPAEQLWFLRDLIVLVIIAPVIRRACDFRRKGSKLMIVAIASAWAVNWQVFPIVAGWRLLTMETLLFFALGCMAVSRIEWIERVLQAPANVVIATCTLWCGLIGARMGWRADFDIWYVNDYGWPDLLLHQASILVGCVALLMIASRIRCESMIRLSGASFFVYLVHEFPLRAVVDRLSDRCLEHSTSCWVETPLVLIGCFAAAALFGRYCPSLFEILTGGRSPESAVRITRSRTHPGNSAHAS